MMIAYDARALDPRWRHQGVGVVLSNLLGRLGRHDFIGLAPRFPEPVPERIRFWNSPSRRLDYLLVEISPWLFRGADLYWGPNNALPAAVRTPSVVTVHDLLFFRYPCDQPWSRLVKPRIVSAIRRATRLVAISRTTADGLIGIFPEVSSKIEVIPNGYSPEEVEGIPEDPPFAFPYAVFVGAQRPRKNLALAIAAVEKARAIHPHLRLVVTGQVHPGFAAGVVRARDFVHCLGVLSRARLFQTLRHAAALLFPSYYEGFGLPLLEAMSAGCPVLALDTSINRETGGDAACYLPDDPHAWARALSRMACDSAAREELCKKGFVNLERFSWDRAADAYAHVFAGLCN